MMPRRVSLLGGEIDLVTPDDVFAFTYARIADGRSGVVANHNLHSLALLRRSPEMRAFYQRADLIEADSTPLIAWGALLGLGLRPRHRCTYLDWRERFWSLAETNGWRVFHLGCAPGVGARAAEALRRRRPGLVIETADGYFDMDGAENDERLGRINAFRPDVVLVGMGMPRQEMWILRNLARLDRGVLFPVGAAFDYEAGAALVPPRWTGRLGLEWLFRFAAEPRRLFVRYFIEPWTLLPAAADDLRRLVMDQPRLIASPPSSPQAPRA